MNKFYYSLNYRFKAQKGRRKHYFFELVDRTSDQATFQLRDKGNNDIIKAQIVVDNSADTPTETANFTYNDIEFQLRADVCAVKGYPITEAGQAEKMRDRQLDEAMGLTSEILGELIRNQTA